MSVKLKLLDVKVPVIKQFWPSRMTSSRYTATRSTITEQSFMMLSTVITVTYHVVLLPLRQRANGCIETVKVCSMTHTVSYFTGEL